MTRLLVLVLCVLAACSGDPADQVLTGRIASEGALAVRAVNGDKIVAAAPVRSDGSFTLVIPTGNYRLEVLTRSGVKHVVGSNLEHLVLAVCDPGAPFDFGGVGDPGMCNPDGTCTPPCDPMTGENCCKDPSDPNCQPPKPCDPGDPSCCMPGDPNCEPPTPCDPTDPMCCKADGNCEPPPPPPPCDPTDPMCCDPATGANCPPPPCMPGDPNCEPPTPCDPNDPMCCKADGSCEPPPPPPPCDDPMDPTTCEDPCMKDPMGCGCPPGDPNCWPEPMPCDDMKCDPGDVMTAEHVPTGFGCKAAP